MTAHRKPGAKQSMRRKPGSPSEQERAVPEAHPAEDHTKSLVQSVRLLRLFEISKLLTRFESLEKTIPAVLATLAEAVPLRSAILLLRDEEGPPHRFVWQRAGTTSASLRRSQAHAQEAYAYFMQNEAGLGQLVHDGEVEPRATGDGVIVLPLVVEHQRIFGTLMLEAAESFDEQDLLFANAATNQIAVAIDRQAAVDARQASAETAEREQRLLADVSALVGSSLDYRDTLASLGRCVVPSFAKLCLIDVCKDEGGVERCQAVLDDDTETVVEERLRHLMPSRVGPTAIASVFASREPVLFPKIRDFVAQGVAVGDEAELLQAAGITSLIAVPLLAREQMLGVLTFGAAESGPYTTRDLALAEELARRAAISIDNARLYEQARRATIARQNLLALVSHDLRSPLGVIIMSLSLLLTEREQADPRVGRTSLMAMQRAANQMKLMIQDMLEASSIEAGQLRVIQRRVEVSPLICEAVEEFAARAASKSLRLESELPADLPALHGDPDRLHQVLANLLGNAIKFTPEGGSITVRAASSGDCVTLSVSDTGTGIEQAELPNIFDRFWQANPTSPVGSGLGLFIVKGIVEAHGGRVWAQSRYGEGSTFRFTIPIARETERSESTDVAEERRANVSSSQRAPDVH